MILLLLGVVWIIRLLIQSVNDLDARVGEAWLGARLRRLWSRINALSARGLITGLSLGCPRYLLTKGGAASVIGLILLVGAIYLMVRWAIWIALVVIEQESAIRAFRHSMQLTRGREPSSASSLSRGCSSPSSATACSFC